MTQTINIHIHRTKARDTGEGEGKWITLSPSGTHVKVDKGGEITAGPSGMAGKKPSELAKNSGKKEPHDPTGMAHAGIPQGTAAVQARIDAKHSGKVKPEARTGSSPEKSVAGTQHNSLAKAANGQQALDLVNNTLRSGSAVQAKAAINASETAATKYEEAAKAFRAEVKHPGNSNLYQHYTERAAAHRENAEHLKKKFGKELARREASASPSGPSSQEIAKHSGKKVQPDKPGWALRADPELAAKFEAAEKRLQAKKLERESGVGGSNWSAANGDWSVARKKGKELVDEALSQAKSSGDKTDALLALKTKAAQEHKKGSYVGAVVVGLVNDYFERLR